MKSGPFWKYHDLINNPKIREVNSRIAANTGMVETLNSIIIKKVNSNPNWKHCIYIEFENGKFERSLILNMLASALVFKNKTPSEIARTENCIWVRTGS